MEERKNPKRRIHMVISDDEDYDGGKVKKVVRDDDIGKKHNFKILLPNGTSIELTLQDPGLEMPFGDFIRLVKEKYNATKKHSDSVKQKRDINWNGDCMFLQDANDTKIRSTVNFKMFKPLRCHILRLHDGCDDVAKTYENMWDLTPDTGMLKELPEEYTFETALADLIDNSLQAVWSNDNRDRRLFRLNLVEDRISIFDSGPGMDDSHEYSIVKWGKIGASLHRSYKSQAIGGKPPYLLPYFGMFGYGGPIASMHLGRRALVSSKTKRSKKVFMLELMREALISTSSSEWKTAGGIRDPSEDEIRDSRHGSFTKVDIFKPKVRVSDIFKLQCHLKDIYFPYIQCDDLSGTGKTVTPIEFKVNDADLTEIEGGEVAITNLHSCNGPEFVLQLHFSLTHHGGIKSPGSRESQEANARLRCVYFPFREGKENIERILEKLENDGCGIRENFEIFSRVSIRRLGRLLPDARWSLLPFMDLRYRKGNRGNILKRCCLRVKCFVETDAGFNPTLSKTDLAHHNAFTIALKNFCSKIPENERNVDIQIYKDRKLLTPLQLEREYQNWILHMHDCYDEEADSGEDQPVYILGPANKKALGISSDVIRVHQILRRKEKTWKRGQRIKVLKGACAGFHKNSGYATIEYFLLEGFEGDSGGEARIICRPIDIPDDNGGVLLVGDDESTSLDIHESLSLPLSVIDSGKLVAVEGAEWDVQLNKKQQKSPSSIDLLCLNHCQQLEVDGVLPMDAHAGQLPPTQVVAVVRPVNFISSASEKLDQKYIFKSNIKMSMEIKFKDGDCERNVHTATVSPSSYKGLNGLYFFPLGCQFPHLFQKAGVYIFSFSLMEPSCKTFKKRVIVKPSPSIEKWGHLTDDQSLPLKVRVGSTFPFIAIACYDIFGNRMPFESPPKVVVKLLAAESESLVIKVDRMNISLSTNKLTLRIKDLLVESTDLDKIRPNYGATLVIASSDEIFSVLIPCQVSPGLPWRVEVQPLIPTDELIPGYVFNELTLELFDTYGNHVSEGLEVTLSVVGFIIQDHVKLTRKVDDNGRIDLSGVLKVTAGYGLKASLSILFEDEIIFKQEFTTVRRELKITSKVPDFCFAGERWENVDFEIVDPDGNIDKSIHHNDKDGQFHMLTIKLESVDVEDSIRYTFKDGHCTIPAITIPPNEDDFCFKAAHSQYPELYLLVKVPVVKYSNVEYNSQLSSPNKSILQLQYSSSFNQENSLLVSLMNDERELGADIKAIGLKIGEIEQLIDYFNNQKAGIEQELFELKGKAEPYCNLSWHSTREEMKKRIESMENSAAAVLCSLSTYQVPQKSFMEDIIGLVALLGTVQSTELSRILAEYVGEDKMLAVICKTFGTVNALERYKQNGEVDCTRALHVEASVLGKVISGRFLVICLEDMRPYRELHRSDPQRKLALPDPTLPNGKTPAGFMGYAVNWVDLDIHHLQTRTASGFGLRETVLFDLFRKVQVYETREYMVAARACIEDGAVSLDGGILRENGIVSLGYGNPTIYFPSKNQMHLSPETGRILKQIEEKKTQLRVIGEDLGKINKHRKKILKRFHKKKEKWNKLMDKMEPAANDRLSEYKWTAQTCLM
ncbi:hypothetical protein L6164_030326 [Bauhinia variegata]|uniref:Uncharacterized protein n=1 Tax=Bauhinia variegata TaxID=167791 RepID=A0ACB9LBX7_BAUVA|nr:hypothetical protein L6164_030326 [Bauhinia variegata]